MKQTHGEEENAKRSVYVATFPMYNWGGGGRVLFSCGDQALTSPPGKKNGGLDLGLVCLNQPFLLFTLDGGSGQYGALGRCYIDKLDRQYVFTRTEGFLVRPRAST